MRKPFVALLLLSTLLLLPAPAGGAQAPGDLAARAQAALSQTSGTVPLAGLQQPVTVLRDQWGVAHIYAQNQHDLFFAQGYVAAQDRLFQMELWKRAGQGRLAEILGPPALERDVNARLLQYRGNMEAEYASYAPDARDILRAFTDGINAFIAQRGASDGPGLPVEFQLAGFAPEPWKPEDCLMRMAGYPLTGNASAELFHAQLVNQLGAARAATLLDLQPRVKLDPAPDADISGLTPTLLRGLVGSDVHIEFPAPTAAAASPVAAALPPTLLDDFGADAKGSNNWVVNGRLTKTGKPMLANDPHRTVALPSLRYLVHLSAPAVDGKAAWDVIGAGEPGLPGVAIGHNQNIAWGITVFPIDQQDLYIEMLNPADPQQYKTEHGWERMTLERAEFRVKGGETAQRELRFTRHGPVIWSDPKRALVLRWVGMEPGTAGYLGSLSVDRAQNWREFLAAMQSWKVPAENIVYADVQGNIGEQSAGLAPWRKNWTGLLPVAGDGKHEWSGFVPLARLPRSFNPAGGFIATANNKVTVEPYGYNIGFQWSAPYRVDRIKQVLGEAARAGKKLTLDDMGKLQSDTESLAARQLVALARAAAQRSAGGLDAARKQTGFALLFDWNGELTRDSGAAALYELFLRSLRRAMALRMVGDKGEEFAAVVETRLPLPVLIALLQHPTRAVFGEDPIALRDQMVLTALSNGVRNLGRLQKNGPATWAWGPLHAIRFRHPLDQFPGVAALADMGPVPRPGDGTTVNASSFGNTGYAQTSGASFREIFDLADWDRSLAINTPGQSAQPGSPHYSDLLSLWDQGQYFSLLYSRGAVEGAAKEKLVLEPK